MDRNSLEHGDEPGGLGAGDRLAALGGCFVHMLGDGRVGLDQLVDGKGRFLGPGGKQIAAVDDRQFGAVVPSHRDILFGADAAVTGQINHQSVGKAQDKPVVGFHVSGQAVLFQGVGQVIIQEAGINAVGMMHRHNGDAHTADLAFGTEAQHVELLFSVAPRGCRGA